MKFLIEYYFNDDLKDEKCGFLSQIDKIMLIEKRLVLTKLIDYFPENLHQKEILCEFGLHEELNLRRNTYVETGSFFLSLTGREKIYKKLNSKRFKGKGFLNIEQNDIIKSSTEISDDDSDREIFEAESYEEAKLYFKLKA